MCPLTVGKGPTFGQAIRLRQLGRNPEDFQDTPRWEISDIIGKGVRKAGFSLPRLRQVQADFWKQERQKQIAQQGFYPGMRVLRPSRQRKGQVEIPDVIMEITDDGHLVFQGLEKSVPPWHIKAMP